MSGKVLQIDIGQVLRSRAAHVYRYMPRFVVRWLERLVCQEQLNELLRCIGDKTGVDAVDIALQQLGVTLKPLGMDNVPEQGKFIFVSNHPLGGLDGLALISLLGHRYHGEIRFLVNDLLMAVEPLRCLFLPVNKFGRQSRDYASLIEQEYAGERQMLTFPAGLCSRLQSDGSIADLPWHKFVVTHAIQHHRDIIPIYFDGHNSNGFYRIARWRKRLGVKFNVEQILLPREMFKSSGAAFSVRFGSPVPWQSLMADPPLEQAERLRQMVYDLATQTSA